MIEYAKENCFDELKLESDNDIAIQLYKINGFEKDELTFVKEF